MDSLKTYAKKTHNFFKKFTKDRFIHIYDITSRLLKTIFFLLIVFLLIVYWNDLDLLKTSKKLIERIAEFKTVEQQIAFRTEDLIPPDSSTDKNRNVYQDGNVVFTTDKIYNLEINNCFIDKMLVQSTPRYKDDFSYNGVRFKITNIRESIGLLIENNKAEGPVVRGVQCEILEN